MDEPARPSRPLPTGTVTLLFADVEGSTRLLHLLGERFAPARRRLREIVRDAGSAWSGVEVDWAGDGAFLAFSRARDAIGAAVHIQRDLAVEPWPPEEALRLRIGVHTGEPELADGGYVGMDVVVASRICASAHGEQVVVSRTAREVVSGESLAFAYKPLGRHRLRSVPAPVEVFQLLADGLREDFPPLRTLSATSLPALHHRLVGRSGSLARIEELLGDREVRLVTITGPGGAGKSRLALEAAAAAALERPVHLVGLAPITDPELVPGAIARAVGAREETDRSSLDGVADTLHGTGALLYLDNLEHLAPVSAQVAELLDRVPDLDILATSRTPLRLSAEHVLPLEPLAVEDAATLFVELAAKRGVVLADDARESVREICRRLDGLPLAIELVVARLVVLAPDALVRALEGGLALDMEGPVDLPERQRTLRAAIDWSYRRLAESQRELHGALAVFANGAALDDARAVAGGDRGFLGDLEALVGWSLVRTDRSTGDVRLSMLETVRGHALAELDTHGRIEELRRRHAERFLELALGAEIELAGREQTRCLDRLERELDNLAAALDWLLSAGRVEDALRALSSLERFWRARGSVTHARRMIALGLELDSDVDQAVRAAALWTAAQLAAVQSDWTSASELLDEARDLYRSAGRTREEVFALANSSFVARVQGQLERAEQLAAEAVDRARELADPRATSAALMSLGDLHSTRSEHAEAIARYEEAVELRTGLGDPLLILDANYNLGLAAFHGDDRARARTSFEEALAVARELGEEPYVAGAQLMLGLLDVRGGDAESAATRVDEGFTLYAGLDDERSCARCLVVSAAAATALDRYADAARSIGAAAALRGSEPPDGYERPLLDEVVPIVEAALGDRAYRELEAEGRTRGGGAPAREVVGSDART